MFSVHKRYKSWPGIWNYMIEQTRIYIWESCFKPRFKATSGKTFCTLQSFHFLGWERSDWTYNNTAPKMVVGPVQGGMDKGRSSVLGESGSPRRRCGHPGSPRLVAETGSDWSVSHALSAKNFQSLDDVCFAHSHVAIFRKKLPDWL